MMAIMAPSPHSIADTRNNLTELIRKVERGTPIGVTRRGKLVAVMVSPAEYERMNASSTGLAEALDRWMKERPRHGVFTRRQIEALRDRRPGRKVRL